tara:strand:- start:924 stop:1247 length:324 start_codon:yes stop_codon:yes gene_type:complete
MGTLTNYTFGDATSTLESPEPPTWKLADMPEASKADNRRWKTAYFIAKFWMDNKYGPTLREIQKEIDVKSLTTIRLDLEALAEGGFVTYIAGQARTLVPTDILLAQV